MKAIFTYPDNPFYINPDYLGNDTVGFQKRIKELKDGTYHDWGTATVPTSTVDGLMTDIGTWYESYQNTASPNISRHAMWLNPLVTQTFETIPEMIVTNLSTSIVGGRMYSKYDCVDHRWKAHADAPIEARYDQEGYIRTPYMDYLTDTSIKETYSSGNPKYPPEIHYGAVEFMHRYDETLGVPGCKIRLVNSSAFVDSDLIKLSNTLSEAHDTGTINSTSTDFYCNMHGPYTIEPYTDAGLTTLATLTENYWGPAITYSSTPAGSTIGITGDPDDFDTESKRILEGAWSFVRVTVTVTDAGSAPGLTLTNNLVNGALSTTLDYKAEFFARIESGVVVLYIDRELDIPATITPSQSTGTFDYTIQVVNLAMLLADDDMISNVFTPYTIALANSSIFRLLELDVSNNPYQRQSIPTVLIPATQTFQYKDYYNVTTDGVGWGTDAFFAGEVATPFSSLGEIEAGQVDAGLNATAQVTYTGGSNRYGGVYNTTENRTFAHPMAQRPSEYVPSSETPLEIAAAEDVFDTDDEWTTTGFDTRKQWPHHVTPSNAVINLNTPSIVNKSQNGVKYTRASGFSKWTLDVEYPPMSHEDFQKFHAIAQAARGQATPFYFVLQDQDKNPIIWSEWHASTNTTDTTWTLGNTAIGDTLLLTEGFASNEANAFIRGEVPIFGNNQNGALHTVINTVESNVYGEAKIRVAMPVTTDLSKGHTVYKNPYSCIVTLSSDDFEYTVGTDGYYRMNVSFDLDGFKS